MGDVSKSPVCGGREGAEADRLVEIPLSAYCVSPSLAKDTHLMT